MDHRYLRCVDCEPPEQFDTLELLNRHWSTRHDGLSMYTCGQCRSKIVHQRSLVRHIKFTHLGKVDLNPSHGCDPSTSTAASSCHRPASILTDSSFAQNDEVCEADNLSEASEEQPAFNLNSESAKFLLKLRSSGNVTGSTVNMIQQYVGDLVKSLVSHLKDETSKFLKKLSIKSDDSSVFLKETFNVGDPFINLESTEKQLAYYNQVYGWPIPTEKYLDSRIENRLDRKLRLFLPTQVPETFQSVSLIETLSFIVKNSYLRSLILSEEPSNDGVYRNYKDGSDFKSNRFLQRYPYAIRLVLNYDDLETANAVGTKDVIHKLGCFYILIQNLPPEEQSLLSSIYLLALTYADDLKKKGAFGKVLGQFLADLKRLGTGEGVAVDLPEGGVFILRACLVNVSADALAAHALLGLMSPSALCFCRRCLITLRDLKLDSTAVGRLRTSRLHEQHVREVERNNKLRSKYGVNERSALDKVMRVPEDCVFDAFHDLVGVIQMDLKLALYEFICVRELFSVFDFNSRVKSFVYGLPDVKNKPSVNFTKDRLASKGHTLKQNGSQTFLLLRVFLFLISGVDENDKYLELIMLLQDIIQIIFSFEFRNEDIDRLDGLIYDHNKLFHSIFISPPPQPPSSESESEGDAAHDNEEENEEEVATAENDTSVEQESLAEEIDDEWETDEEESERPEQRRRTKKWKSKVLKKGINKIHHLRHYPSQFREKGPLIRLWCARFEGRHRIIRKHAGIQSCFKNIPKTMAKMVQLSTLGSVLERNKPREIKISTKGTTAELVRNSPFHQDLLRRGLAETEQIMMVESVEVCGEEYVPGLFVAMKTNRRLPVFALIETILVEVKEPRRLFLVVSESHNEGLSGRYNAYKVSNNFDKTLSLACLDELAHRRPIAPWIPCESQGQAATDLFLAPRTVFV